MEIIDRLLDYYLYIVIAILLIWAVVGLFWLTKENPAEKRRKRTEKKLQEQGLLAEDGSIDLAQLSKIWKGEKISRAEK